MEEITDRRGHAGRIVHVQVVASRHDDQLAMAQQSGAFAPQRLRKVGLRGFGVDHPRRTLDMGDQVAALRLAHAHGGRHGQARIAAPDETAVDRPQAAFDQQRRCRLAEIAGTGAQARADRGGDIGEHAQLLARQRGVGGERITQALRGAFLGFGQRAQGFDGQQALDPAWLRGRHQAGDHAAERMAEQRKALPAQRIGGGERRAQERDQQVIRRSRQVRARAVARHVDRHQVDIGQVRGQRHETGRVVEPAMQGEHARRTCAARAQPGQRAEGGFQRECAHRAHAGCAAVAASASRAIAASTRACASLSLRQGM